jgi:hypothetical protein
MAIEKHFALRRSIYPYSVYIIACVVISLLGLFDWMKLHDPSPFEASFFVWIVVVATQYGNSRYRIFWNDGEIKQISADKFITTIRTSEVTHVGQERSDLRTRFQLRRPADRIAIYAGHGEQERHIDVSLRHFVARDIRQLLRQIHDRRPDLVLPKGWV